ncbi:hypothetical protein halTADL_2767 [Halohasta litchfieldiae]|jgi:hypothetical protein|uniref:Uncharacterized protein n=1 Tax=Halohasta litchfieldiae TaxID=1073996 RepID=A0A1H6UZ85_9EURY|nr:hypothetical protein halTADL_2767 [Halohasta litchfieldiae]SEI93355.1 hypothetical protein SAMN05444271_11263 [Halohasta litchfieldiae]
MAVGSTLFAVLIWGSVGSVLAVFGYISWLLIRLRRTK